MKNLLLTICILLMFGMSWLTFREMKEFQMKVDMLIERVEAIEEDAEYVDLEEKKESVSQTESVKEVEKVEGRRKKSKNVKKAVTVKTKDSENVTTTISPDLETRDGRKTETKVKKEINPNDIVVTQFKKNYIDREEIITFKNNTPDKINRIKGVIVYRDMEGNDISYNEIDIKLTIAPGMSKQTKINSFDQDHKYCYYKEYQSFMGVSGITRFTFEFKLESYN